MTLKKREFTPESGSVDTYAIYVAELVSVVQRTRGNKKRYTSSPSNIITVYRRADVVRNGVLFYVIYVAEHVFRTCFSKKLNN